MNILLNTHLNGLSIEEINLGMIAALKQQAGIHSDIVGEVLDAVAEAIKADEDLEIYTSGANNWNNFVVVLTREDNTEYAVVRADNYGWGASYDDNTNLVTSGGQSDWATWLAAMNESVVTVSIVNNGDGTADIKSVMLGNDGNTYYQDYIGITPVDADDLYFRFTVDGCRLVFE